MVHLQGTATATESNRRPVMDLMFAIVFFVAVFAVEIALVEFAGSEPSLVGDKQVMILPIT